MTKIEREDWYVAQFENLTLSKPDELGSRRLLCRCGTHFNTYPDSMKQTIKWIDTHGGH
jgi:hypothetical protein